jgi:Winged helix DNA-binding domain
MGQGPVAKGQPVAPSAPLAPLAPLEIARRRLASQRLTTPTVTDPAEIVRLLGAVQSQDYAGAKWALAMRARGASDATIERAFADGSIVRTHVLRPTWHFVTPADIRWMLALTAPRVKAAMAYYDRKLELDDAVFRRSNAAIIQALRDGKQLTRAELGETLRRGRIDVTGSQRLGHLLLRAELDGIVCSGARRGKQFTYALLDERVPPTAPVGRDEALLELTRRYFTTRGPATANDFAWWSGLTVADAKRGIEITGSALEREVIDDRTYWADPTARRPGKRSPAAYLLPNYDEYFIGFKDRGAIGVRLKSSELVTGGDALTAHVVIVDGQLVGGWKRTLTRNAVLVELKLLTRLSDAERRAVHEASQAYGTFLGLPVELHGLDSRQGAAPSAKRATH